MLNFVWRRQTGSSYLLRLLLVVFASPMVLAKEKIQWAESIEKGFAEAEKNRQADHDGFLHRMVRFL